MVAAKFFDDQYFNNAYYAKVGGVPCLEMNALETELLFLLNFHLFVTSGEFAMYKNQLLHHANVSCKTCGRDTYLLKPQASCAAYEVQPPDWVANAVNFPSPSRRSRVRRGSKMYNYVAPHETQPGIGSEAPIHREMVKHHVSDDRMAATNAGMSYRGIFHPSGIGNSKLRAGGHRREMFQVA